MPIRGLRRLAVFIRRDALAAISVVGLALNLIGGLGPLVALARLARYIVEHWLWLTSIAWIKLFGLFHVAIPPVLGFACTVFLFHLGLATSGLRWGRQSANALPGEEAETLNRDRLIALALYLPIMWGTLATAFGSLANRMSLDAPVQPNWVVILAFSIVVASPILAFSLARPRQLIRRFISVYAVAIIILLLDLLSRVLEKTGLRKFIGEQT